MEIKPALSRNQNVSGKTTAQIDEAITGRKSLRQFLDTPVERAVVEDILRVASRAPSGTNMQPWRVYVVAGEVKKSLSKDLMDAHHHHQGTHKSEYSYYPDTFSEPYKSRRKKVGIDMYGLLEINKGEVEKMHAQHLVPASCHAGHLGNAQ